MAFVLNEPYGVLEPYRLFKLAALKQLATTSPFSVSQAKTDIETSQTTTFSAEAWNEFLKALYDMQGGDLDLTQLTAAEQDIFNQLREHLTPAPFLSYCADEDPTAGLVTLSATQNLNSTLQYEMRVQFNEPFKCSIVKVEATQTAGSLTPSNVPDLALIGPLGTGNTYSGLWLTFGDSPAGTGTYSYDLVFKDIDDNVVGSTINKSITF